MVLVDLEITLTLQRQAEAAMFGNLLQHVIKKTEAGCDVDR